MSGGRCHAAVTLTVWLTCFMEQPLQTQEAYCSPLPPRTHLGHSHPPSVLTFDTSGHYLPHPFDSALPVYYFSVAAAGASPLNRAGQALAPLEALLLQR